MDSQGEIRYEGKSPAEPNPRSDEVMKVFLPPVLLDDTEFINEAWQHVDPALIEENISLINSVTDSRLDPADREPFAHYRDYINVRYRQYKGQLSKLGDAPHVTDALQSIDPTVAVVGGDRQDVRAVADVAHDLLTEAKGDILFLSGSHASGWAELRALKEVAGKKKIALVVIDNHADIYDRESYRKHRRDTGADLSVGKANFVAHLLDDDTIDSVSFIGVPQHSIHQIETGYAQGDDFAPTHEIYEAFADRIMFANESRYVNRNGLVDRYEFEKEMQRQANFFKSRNVDTVIFSVDFDAFQHPFSAVEYNNLGSLLYLGLQDFSQAKEAAMEEYRALPASEQGAFDVLVSRDRKIAHAVLRELSLPAAHIGDKRDFGRPKGAGGYKLRLSDAGIAMDVIERELPVGIDLPGGGICPGGITELSAYDIGGQTARAVRAISERMLRVARKSAKNRKGPTYTS